jgi:UDP-N-acetyl-D-glucosamine dehydrogenase
MIKIKKVAVLGLGYVGLPLAMSINDNYQTIGYDISQKTVDSINLGVVPFFDPELEKELKSKSLQVTKDITKLIDTDLFIVAVPTPIDEYSQPNLIPIRNACKDIAKIIKKGAYVIIESTINPGVCDDYIIPILESEAGMIVNVDFYLAHCPERINPGDKKWNVRNIPRNIGSSNQESCKILADFYRNVLDKGVKVFELETIKEAEATKIVENVFRDVNIAFVNELAMSFDKMGINLKNVLAGSATKPFGFMAHHPGVGVGGHCIAVDPYYLIQEAYSYGFAHNLVKKARDINSEMPKYCVEKVIAILKTSEPDYKNQEFCILGLSYKANVGDTRESPAYEVIKELLKHDLKVKIFDPFVLDQSDFKTLEDAVENSNILMICTNHKEFEKIPELNLKNCKLIFDGKNMFNKLAFEKNKLFYCGVGV